MSLLLDTHAALWLVEGNPRLGPAVRERVSRLSRDELHVSDMVLLELSMLISKGRVVVASEPAVFLREFAARFHLIRMDSDIAAAAMDIDLPHGDPFDRVLVATAIHHTLPFATRDSAIRDSGLVETVW